MHAFLLSMGVVALAEVGDKTQLLALVMSARFRRPLPIIGGIFAATIANHAAAAALGAWLTQLFSGETFKIVLGLSFLFMGAWTLKPDKLSACEKAETVRWGAFLTTLTSFFVVEIGDKTQVATVGLAAQYQSIAWVAAGTTIGMMIANVPVILLGSFSARCLPLALIRRCAACLFALLGGVVLAEAFGWLAW